jgi:hypothetical protein
MTADHDKGPLGHAFRRMAWASGDMDECADCSQPASAHKAEPVCTCLNYEPGLCIDDTCKCPMHHPAAHPAPEPAPCDGSDAGLGCECGKDEAHPIPAASWTAPLLHGWANQIAARFNRPVYLVGSALREAKPRDTDVVVILPDEEFRARYGLSGLETQMLGDAVENTARFWADVAKLSAWCNQHHGNGSLNVDFKVQDESQVKARQYDTSQRIRLDSLDVPVDWQSAMKLQMYPFEASVTHPNVAPEPADKAGAKATLDMACKIAAAAVAPLENEPLRFDVALEMAISNVAFRIRDLVGAAEAAARKEEREECAKVAEAEIEAPDEEFGGSWNHACYNVAQRIRARGGSHE